MTPPPRPAFGPCAMLALLLGLALALGGCARQHATGQPMQPPTAGAAQSADLAAPGGTDADPTGATLMRAVELVRQKRIDDARDALRTIPQDDASPRAVAARAAWDGYTVDWNAETLCARLMFAARMPPPEPPARGVAEAALAVGQGLGKVILGVLLLGLFALSKVPVFLL